MSAMRRGATYLGDSFQPSGFKWLDRVQNNEVMLGTLEQGTQRIEVLQKLFTEVLEGELGKLTWSGSSSKPPRRPVPDMDEAVSNWRTTVLSEEPPSDADDLSM